MCAIDLIEPPEKVFRRAIDIRAARVVGEIVAEWALLELRLEQIDLIQEEDDTRPHEPPRVDDRVKQHQALHHPILHKLCVSKKETPPL